jgi:prepilin-type N-terminal cleavage/methylation domain-containing protein
VTRRAFTLIELLMATVISTLVALAVYGTISAVQLGVSSQDEITQETARVARAQSRIADHLYRARMILAEAPTQVCLWLPSEAFDGTSQGATNYDTINADELRWYVVDTQARTVSMQRVANRNNRTSYPLSTDWAALRSTLQQSGALESAVVLTGVASGQFRFTSFNQCSTVRVVLDLQFDADHGGYGVELGGILALLQRHPDCP